MDKNTFVSNKLVIPLEEVQNNSTDIWSRSLNLIRTRVNGQTFKAWFEPIIPKNYNGEIFLFQVPSQFFSEWLEEHYFSLLNEILTKVTGREVGIEYVIAPDEQVIEVEHDSVDEVRSPQKVSVSDNLSNSISSQKHLTSQEINSFLNPRYTFENYIKGESNQFARAAALAVANNPGGTSFNPLVIYGGVGLGKTHLVHAIGNHVRQTGKSNRILYVSSEKFTVDFVEAIQKDKIKDFSSFYRNSDLLIVDDIQFFSGKEKTQDIFFYTFNALHQLGKQIVLSSDKSPKDLQGLNERLISRFQWGLTADIQPPDLETRIAILQKKSYDNGIELSRSIVEFIALNVTSNIRELEGCLIGLFARASLESRKIDLDLAKSVVRSVVGEVRTHITIEEIQRVVAEYFNIPEDMLRAKTRKQEIVNARQIAMYFAKEMTNSSLKTIGLHFGGRDHSTVIHAYQTVEDLISTDPKQKQIIQHLKSKLERGMC